MPFDVLLHPYETTSHSFQIFQSDVVRFCLFHGQLQNRMLEGHLQGQLSISYYAQMKEHRMSRRITLETIQLHDIDVDAWREVQWVRRVRSSGNVKSDHSHDIVCGFNVWNP